MNDPEMDELLARALGGDQPRALFREHVLQQSMAAFVRGRRRRMEWRMAVLSGAAVLIAGVSFLLGRWSLPQGEIGLAPVVTPVASGEQTVTVPSELVAWLDAARLFRQLGMEDRMARAVDRASQLLPCDTIAAGGETGSVFAAGGRIARQEKDVGPEGRAGLHEPVEGANRVMAQSFGD